MYPPHHLGGYELVWQSAVAHLRARGHEVRVLTTDYRQRRAPRRPRTTGTSTAICAGTGATTSSPASACVSVCALERGNAARPGAAPRAASPRRRRVVGDGRDVAVADRGGAAAAGSRRVGFVHDDWLVYGPRVDQWTAPARPRRGWRRSAERLTGVPTGSTSGRRALGVRQRVSCARRSRERPRPADVGVAHSGHRRRRFRGPRPSASGAGGCSTSGASTRARASRPRSRRSPRCREATLTVVGERGRGVRCGRCAARGEELGVGRARQRSRGDRAARAAGRVRRAPTPCCSPCAGTSRGASCRSRRWPRPPGGGHRRAAAPPSTCATGRTACSFGRRCRGARRPRSGAWPRTRPCGRRLRAAGGGRRRAYTEPG